MSIRQGKPSDIVDDAEALCARVEKTGVASEYEVRLLVVHCRASQRTIAAQRELIGKLAREKAELAGIIRPPGEPKRRRRKNGPSE